MDDVVHVQIQVVELDAVGIWRGAVHWDDVVANVLRLVLDAVHDDLRVPVSGKHRLDAGAWWSDSRSARLQGGRGE